MSLPPLPEIFGNYALKDFVEIAASPAISWLPQTAGWFWLGVALLALAARYTWKRLKFWYDNRYRREAVVRLQRLAKNPDPQRLVADLNQLLKLVALVAYSRDRVAKLSGPPWADFLDRQCSTPAFSESQLQLLATGSYQPRVLEGTAAQSLLNGGLKWINEHRGMHDV